MAAVPRADDPRGAGDPDRPGTVRVQETALIEAATALLEEGAAYGGLSVGAIAARAGQTRTGFYQYFRDKRDLLLAATDQVVAGLFDDADHWWSGTGGRTELRAALSRIAEHFRGSRVLVRALVEAAGSDPVVAAHWNDEIGRFVVATRDRLVRDGHEAREAGEIAAALVWMVERSLHQLILSDRADGDAARVDALTTVWARTLSLGP